MTNDTRFKLNIGAPIIGAVLALIAVSLLTGCASDASRIAREQARADAYRVHAAQARAVPVLTLEGTGMAIHVTGATRIAVTQPVDPLPQLERDPTGGEVAVEIIKAITPAIPYAAMVGIAKYSGTTRETSNTSYIEKMAAEPAEAAAAVEVVE